MVGDLPAEAIHADLGGHGPRQIHLLVAVVPFEKDVPPVQKRKVASGTPFFVNH